MIRRAVISDVSQLQNLWRECFCASDEELSFFFLRLFCAHNTWVYEKGGNVCAMLYVIPYQIEKDGNRYPVHYFYAIGTTEKQRGNGFAADLIKHAIAMAKSEGCPFCFLVPQSESLFAYYEKFGFYPYAKRSLPEFEPVGFKNAELSDIPKLNEIYERALKNRLHLIRTCEDWKVLVDGMKILVSEDSYVVYHEKGYIAEGFGGAMRKLDEHNYAAFCILDDELMLTNGYFNLLHD